MVTVQRAKEIMHRIYNMTVSEIENGVTVEKKRADIVKSGFVLLEKMADRISAEKIIIGRCGVREGILYEMAR